MRRSFLVVAMAWGLAAGASAADAKLAPLLDRMHKVTSAEGQPILAEIVKLGSPGVREICAMLLPPGKGNDANAHFALHGLAMYVSRPGADDERKMFVIVLIEALRAAQDKDVKGFLIRQLQLAGKDDAVEALSGYLADPPLCDPAAQALTQIATPAATEALLKVLPAAQDAARVTLIKAMGVLRVKAAVPALLKDASGDDRTAHFAALHALADIGDPAAAGVLAKAADAASPYERSQGVSCYLLFARRQAEAGDKAACAKICRELLKSHAAPRERNVTCAALATLAEAVGEAASPDLLAALEHKDDQVRAAALRIIETLPGKELPVELARRATQAPVPLRVQLLPVLARLASRGKRLGEAESTVLEALHDKDKAIRLAAIPAVAEMDRAGAVEPLLDALRGDQPDEAKLIQRVLLPLIQAKHLPLVVARLPQVPPASRAVLLDILAARGTVAQLDAALASTGDAEPTVRLAAIKALGALADEKAVPKLIELLLKAEGAEQGAVQRAVVAACERIPQADQRGGPILAALGSAQSAKRALLLRTLPRLGGDKALQAVAADTKSAEADVQDAAVRALADWPDVAAVPELLTLARTAASVPQQVLALQGCVRLASDPKLSAERRVAILKDALAAAKRPEEKRLVLAGLAGVRSIESLKVVAPFLDDAALQGEAAAAAVRIACPQDRSDKGLQGGEVAAALQKVVEVAKDANVRKQAEDQLKRVKPGS